MSVVLDQIRCNGFRVSQVLDLNDDSISFVNSETNEMLYRVDSGGYLTNSCEEQIGKFCLQDTQWVLKIDDEIFVEGPENSLFMLPEFEVVAITKLLNSMDK